MDAAQPRPLTLEERGVLSLLLSRDLPDVGVLREQAKLATVLRRCACGCPSVDLAVPDLVPAATLLPDGLLPVEGVVRAVPAPL